ncbi:MAG: Holliday junction resolvase RuvX [Anaerovoracaceae bacterium]|jgi:putative Holliday junction resolvase
MKVMALDVGDKTIGVALSDELLLTAQGLTTIERIGIKKDTGKILDLIRDNQCNVVVVGLPLKLDGSDSPQTEKVREFTAALKNKLRSNGLQNVEVKYQDERFSTAMAERILIDADVSRKKRKTVIDKQAAVIILQSYLDARPKA